MGSPVNLIRSKENKNLLINGNFDLWQRGTTVSGASKYGSDRWRGNSSVASVQRRDKAFSAGLPLSARFGCQLTSLVGGGGFGQRIEAAKLVGMTGRYLTLSFKAGLVSGTTPLSMNIGVPTVIDNYTSVTFVENAVLGTPIAHGISYQTFTRTFQVSADMEARGFEVNIFGDATVWSIIFSQIMLLEAPDGQTVFVPNEFVYAADNLTEEIILCQRYFEKTYALDKGINLNDGDFDGCAAFFVTNGFFGSSCRFMNTFKVQKRAAPIVITYNPNDSISYRARNVSGATTSTSILEANTHGFVVASASTIDGTGFFRFHWTADAEL